MTPAALADELRRIAVVTLGGAAADGDPAPLEPELRQAIGPYGGRLEQLAGGTTIVVLEADRHVATDHAARAARCALALRGLATGRPMAIAMGRVEPIRPLSISDVVDRAVRLVAQAATAPGAPPPIGLDELSAGLLDARFEVIDRGTGLVLCGERALIQGARTLLGRSTSCVGRDWELDVLAGFVDECIDEQKARATVVLGPAGIGKSRLAAELVRRVKQRYPAVAIWGGRGDSLRAGSTLDLLAQALRGAIGIRGSEPLAERRDQIRTRVTERVPAADRKRVTEFLGELVGAAFSGDGEDGAALRAARQDAQLMSEQMRRAWLDFLQAETSAQPVLLLLEDLHWSDFGTVRFIDMALRDRPDRPWTLLALARPEVHEIFPRLWAERHNVQEIRLKGLGRKASERLVLQVLGDGVEPETMVRLVQQADGNAFYLEELIRAAAEGKAEGKDRDTGHLLPGTVLAMVETRLARLPAGARRVLRAASVFGEVCWEGGVAALLGRGIATRAREWLDMLVDHELLVARPDSRFPGERELAFRHALLREGAYATLTTEDQRRAHHLAGEWLAQHGEGDPMVLAGHFERGGQRARAAGFYLRAAQQAVHVLDLDATFVRTELGLGCVPSPELRIALLGVRCVAAQAAQRVVIAEAEELLDTAPRGSIPWAQGMRAYLMGALMAGRIDDLRAQLALLRDVTPAADAAGWMAVVLVSGVMFLDILGCIAQGTALEDTFRALVRARGDQEPLARIWWNVVTGARASHAHDDPWTALLHGEAIQPLFDAIGGETVFLNMQLTRGMNRWFLGAFASAVRTLEGIPAADTALGMASPLRRFVLSWLHADRGALDQARVLATQLAESGRARGSALDEGRGRWVLAEVLRRAGELEAADRELEVALGMAVPLEHPGMLA
ncbi:MAG TPA: AAA family ATPase, partial [Kofleriaceae bacterium]